MEISKCILESFHPIDDKIELHFKNGRAAILEAKNPKGSLEIGIVEKKLENFIGKSYEEILNADF